MADIGTQITNNSQLVELPFGTLLVGDRGDSYRIGDQYAQKTIVHQSISGSTSEEPVIANDVNYHGGYTLTIVWMPSK